MSDLTLTADAAVAGLLGLALGLVLGLLGFLRWKIRHTKSIRRDAAARSQAVTAGKVFEQLVPILPGFDYDPREVRFLGSPVDFVVFDGLASGRVERVVFLEIKTGAATLSARERAVRDAIEAGRVVWREWRAAPPSTGR
ncbi:MAG: Holliday junction resolvase-like protein [Gemmatimonadales bacterium]